MGPDKNGDLLAVLADGLDKPGMRLRRHWHAIRDEGRLDIAGVEIDDGLALGQLALDFHGAIGFGLELA